MVVVVHGGWWLVVGGWWLVVVHDGDGVVLFPWEVHGHGTDDAFVC